MLNIKIQALGNANLQGLFWIISVPQSVWIVTQLVIAATLANVCLQYLNVIFVDLYMNNRLNHCVALLNGWFIKWFIYSAWCEKQSQTE